MNDTSQAGSAYNAIVFGILKNWIHNVLPPPSEPYALNRVADRFAECATLFLRQRGYLNNISEIVLERKHDEVVYVPKKIDEGRKITMTGLDGRRFYSNVEDFRPVVRDSYSSVQANS